MASEKSKRREPDACKKSGLRVAKMSANRRRTEKRRLVCAHRRELFAAMDRILFIDIGSRSPPFLANRFV